MKRRDLVLEERMKCYPHTMRERRRKGEREEALVGGVEVNARTRREGGSQLFE